MKKKSIILIAAVIFVLAMLVAVAIPYLLKEMYAAQYNANGVSHFLVITVDPKQQQTWVGTLDGRDIYLEGLNADETFFRNVNAENVTLQEAFANHLVSIDEWREYAGKTERKDDFEILSFQNYEIFVGDRECMIRPLIR